MRTSAEKELFYEELAQKQEWDDFANTFETKRRLSLVFDHFLSRVDLRGVQLLDGGSGGGHFSAEAVRRGAADVTGRGRGPTGTSGTAL